MTDTTFSYQVEGHPDAAQCRLRVFEQGDRAVVLATALPDQPGPSITEVAEVLATQVAEQYSLDPEQIVWIEHYPEAQRPEFGGELPGGTFDLVEFTWEDSQAQRAVWSPLTREEVEVMTGAPLED